MVYALQSATLQFLRELHFIEASSTSTGGSPTNGCSSFGNCTSLRQVGIDTPIAAIDPHLLAFCASPSRPAWLPPGRRAGR